MHRRLKTAALLVTSLAFVLGGGVMAAVQGKPKPKSGNTSGSSANKPDNSKPQTTAKPPVEKITVHGGVPHNENEHAFEVVFLKTGIHVYAYDMKGEPVSADALSGSATVMLKKAGEKPQEVTLKPTAAKTAGGRGFLAGDTDVTGAASVKISIKGLKGEKEKEVAFDLPFSGLSPEVKYVCPKCSGEQADPGECSKDKVKLEKKSTPAPKT